MYIGFELDTDTDDDDDDDDEDMIGTIRNLTGDNNTRRQLEIDGHSGMIHRLFQRPPRNSVEQVDRRVFAI